MVINSPAQVYQWCNHVWCREMFLSKGILWSLLWGNKLPSRLSEVVHYIIIVIINSPAQVNKWCNNVWCRELFLSTGILWSLLWGNKLPSRCISIYSSPPFKCPGLCNGPTTPPMSNFNIHIYACLCKLTHKAPPIICSRQQFSNFSAFFKNNK